MPIPAEFEARLRSQKARYWRAAEESVDLLEQGLAPASIVHHHVISALSSDVHTMCLSHLLFVQSGSDADYREAVELTIRGGELGNAQARQAIGDRPYGQQLESRARLFTRVSRLFFEDVAPVVDGEAANEAVLSYQAEVVSEYTSANPANIVGMGAVRRDVEVIRADAGQWDDEDVAVELERWARWLVRAREGLRVDS